MPLQFPVGKSSDRRGQAGSEWSMVWRVSVGTLNWGEPFLNHSIVLQQCISASGGFSVDYNRTNQPALPGRLGRVNGRFSKFVLIPCAA